MLEFLLSSLAAVFVLTVLAFVTGLCLPLRMAAVLDTGASPVLVVKAAMFGGLLPVFSPAGMHREKSSKRSAQSTSRKATKRKRRNKASIVVRVMRELPGLALGILRRIRLDIVDADIRFGFPDPADTGAIYGALICLEKSSNMAERSNVILRPDFGNPVLEGRAHIGLSVVPAALIGPVFGFAWATIISPRLQAVLK